MKEPAPCFRYTARQWAPIAKTLGRYGADAKAALEEIANRYQSSPDKAAEAENYKRMREVACQIANAIDSLCDVLEATRRDYIIGGESLLEALSVIAEVERDEASEAKRDAPANREDRRRNRYLNEVIGFMRQKLGSRGQGSVDRVTGETLNRGAVALLRAIANPVLPSNYPLTPGMARNALRDYVAPARPIDWPRVLEGSARELDDDIPDMAD